MKPRKSNPRRITPQRLEELRDSLVIYGDLSGIVHNLETDEIIGGNQRMKIFAEGQVEIVRTLDEPDEQGTVAHGFIVHDGKRYAYRQVRWDEKKAAEANIRANLSAGEWDWSVLAAWQADDLAAGGLTGDRLLEMQAAAKGMEKVVGDMAGDLLGVPGDAKPNKRILPIDAIFTWNASNTVCCLAIQAGLKYGTQSNKESHLSLLCPCLNSFRGRHKVVFVDNNYFDYVHTDHLLYVEHFRPKYATVKDIMTEAQCANAGIQYTPLGQILDWAQELEQYAENVILIPKYDCLDEIPERYMLGYSVPSSHGGTPLPVSLFKGRRVHLLGGSWKAQLAHMAALGEDVVSLDNNMVALLASYGTFIDADGAHHTIPYLVNNIMYVCLALSFGAIGRKLFELGVADSAIAASVALDEARQVVRGELDDEVISTETA